MGRAQSVRQGDLLALMEPGATVSPGMGATVSPGMGATVSPGMRASLIPLVAALLLEAATTGPGSEETDGEARVREAGDEPDHA